MSDLYRVEPWERLRDVKDRTKAAWGLCLHAAGSTITCNALDKGRDPNAFVAEFYARPNNQFPHDIVIWDHWNASPSVGIAAEFDPVTPDVVQSAHWQDRSWAQGLGRTAIQIYQRADWDQYVKHPEEGYIDTDERQARYEWWLEKHGFDKNPLDLYPGRDPNQVLLSMEMVVPVERKNRGGYRRARFTDRQHDVAAFRAAQMAHAFDWPLDEVRQRMLGHEDVHPVTRTSRKGPWDPGAGTWFDWESFFAKFSVHYVDQAGAMARKSEPTDEELLGAAETLAEPEPNTGPMEHD
jgi:hypothetical protein